MQNPKNHSATGQPRYNSNLNQGGKKTWGPLKNDKTKPNYPQQYARQYITKRKTPPIYASYTIYCDASHHNTQNIWPNSTARWLCPSIFHRFFGFFFRVAATSDRQKQSPGREGGR
jgi:hypothetical protein